jgi:hypothetical protein
MGAGGRLGHAEQHRPLEMIDPLDDGLDELLVDDLDVPNDFQWQPRTQAAPSITAHRHRPARRRAEDHRARGALAGVLTPLPTPGESIDIILPGNVALGDVLWHIVDSIHLPGPLAVATLGFGRKWIAGLVDRLRSGQITEAKIACSDYFAKADAAEFLDAQQTLAGWPVTLRAGRTHAKVATFTDITMAGSANLRSCRSIENLTVTNNPALAAFHRQWITDLTSP